MNKIFRDPFMSAAIITLFTFILAGFAVMVGCTSNSAGPTVKSSQLTYSKDPQTGICFASMNSLDAHSGWKTTTITYVPCTPEVEKAIAK